MTNEKALTSNLETALAWLKGPWQASDNRRDAANAAAVIERLRAVLLKYGRHAHPNCHDLTFKEDGSFGPRNGCLCGLDSVLSGDSSAPKNPAPWEFDRYVAGHRRAEGIKITRAADLEHAIEKAVELAQPHDVLVLRQESAIETTTNDSADAARFRWLAEDIANGEERSHRNRILQRMAVMSYSAVTADIDAAMIAYERAAGAEICSCAWDFSKEPWVLLHRDPECAKHRSSPVETATGPSCGHPNPNEEGICPVCRKWRESHAQNGTKDGV